MSDLQSGFYKQSDTSTDFGGGSEETSNDDVMSPLLRLVSIQVIGLNQLLYMHGSTVDVAEATLSLFHVTLDIIRLSHHRFMNHIKQIYANL